MTPEVWYSVHHPQFLFCLHFFDITLMSFCRVLFSFLGIHVPLVIFSCIQRRLPFPSFPFSRTVCLVSSEGSHDPRGLVPDRSFAFRLVSFLEWHYADEPFLDFSNFLPSHPTPIPTPAPDFDGRIWFRVSFIVSLFCGCMMIGYAVSVFTLLFFLFQLSTARVRHVPIRMVSSI